MGLLLFTAENTSFNIKINAHTKQLIFDAPRDMDTIIFKIPRPVVDLKIITILSPKILSNKKIGLSQFQILFLTLQLSRKHTQHIHHTYIHTSITNSGRPGKIHQLDNQFQCLKKKKRGRNKKKREHSSYELKSVS